MSRLYGVCLTSPEEIRVTRLGRFCSRQALATIKDELPARAQGAADHGGRGHRGIGGQRREVPDQAVCVGRHTIRRLNHQMLKRPAIGRDPLLEALLHLLHDQSVFLHAGDGVSVLTRR